MLTPVAAGRLERSAGAVISGVLVNCAACAARADSRSSPLAVPRSMAAVELKAVNFNRVGHVRQSGSHVLPRRAIASSDAVRLPHVGPTAIAGSLHSMLVMCPAARPRCKLH